MIIAKVIEQERLRICHTCDEFFAMTNMCRKCGCVMPLKAKLTASKCPMGKWEAARKAAVAAELAKKNS